MTSGWGVTSVLRTAFHARAYRRETSARDHVLLLLVGLGMQRDDARRRRDGRLRGVLANEHDVSVADAIDPPVELVLGAVAAADVHHLGPADERALVDDSPLARRVDEHRARLVRALHDGDELELVDRVLRELHLALVERLLVHRLVLDDEAAERIAVAIALDEVVLGVVGPFELGGQPRGARGSDGCRARRWRGRRRAADGRIATRKPEGHRGE